LDPVTGRFREENLLAPPGIEPR